MASSVGIILVICTFGLMVLMLSHIGLQHDKISLAFKPSVSVENNTFPVPRRQLLNSEKKKCSKGDIRITQATLPPQRSGIPTYLVEITNLCRTGCAIRNIKIYCAGFSSTNLINPLIFRHLPAPNHDYCIVNNGDPLKAGAIVQFRYFNTFMFKAFSVSSVTCVS
ncbi:hypothetical protein Dsin_007127 [Dipteronia sinensis]|uniref:Uncharacterized protein n=1 Tax=Dipteronia sinensis TaxID=43782 RepID=A0AAE0B0W9_9ROSI|nr:hypothetical protein Dsin_007127 [Dipteronia sinensis]